MNRFGRQVLAVGVAASGLALTTTPAFADPIHFAGSAPGAPGGGLAAAGVWSVATLVWSGIASLLTGLGISLLCHRYTTRNSLVHATRRDTPPVE